MNIPWTFIVIVMMSVASVALGQAMGSCLP